MLFDERCKMGKLQATEDGTLRVQAPFNKIAWEVPCAAVTGLITQPGTMNTLNVTIQTTQGVMHQAEMMSKANVTKLQALFPNLQTVTAGKEWYHDPTISTHVETYTDQKKMQREVEEAGKLGWVPTGSAGVGSHINVGRTVTKLVLTGGLGMMTGASRSKEKMTITFIRQSN
jgi:hypothetical protein